MPTGQAQGVPDLAEHQHITLVPRFRDRRQRLVPVLFEHRDDDEVGRVRLRGHRLDDGRFQVHLTGGRAPAASIGRRDVQAAPAELGRAARANQEPLS
jgi:hypothetical protein